MKDRAQLVVIGAGIVGASAAYHLAELGITDVLVIDQGPLFETGGSTSHAPGLVFQTNGSRTMCRLAQYSVDLYSGLESDGSPAWYGVGGIEVATTDAASEVYGDSRGAFCPAGKRFTDGPAAFPMSVKPIIVTNSLPRART